MVDTVGPKRGSGDGNGFGIVVCNVVLLIRGNGRDRWRRMLFNTLI
jgi:hypothetical protein